MTLVSSSNLTEPREAEQALRIARTHAGMATWAGTGPAGRVCRDCQYLPKPKDAPVKPAPCGKYTELMRGRRGEKVPPTADACKHFVERRRQ